MAPSDTPDPSPALRPEDLFAPVAPSALSRRERAAVIARIEALMEYWGITPEDLDAAPAPVDTPAPAFIKYRHPVDRKSTRLNSSHSQQSRMPSSA